MNHTIVFIASLADVWSSKSVTSKDCEMKSKFFLVVSDDQLRLVSLMLDIKVNNHHNNLIFHLNLVFQQVIPSIL